MWPRYINVTDGRTDGRTTYITYRLQHRAVTYSVVVKTFLKNSRPTTRPWVLGLETKTKTERPRPSHKTALVNIEHKITTTPGLELELQSVSCRQNEIQ